MKPIKSIDDPRYIKAMSHPLRVRILAVLEQRTASPNELAQAMGATLGTVAYHVRHLANLGLIELVKETPRRGAVEHHYRANARPKVTDEAWAKASPIAKQAAIGSSLQLISEYAGTSAAAGGFDRADAALQRMSFRLDAKGFAQLAKEFDKLSQRAERIAADADLRVQRDPHAEDIVDVGVVLMLFEATDLVQAAASKKPSAKRRARRTGAAA